MKEVSNFCQYFKIYNQNKLHAAELSMKKVLQPRGLVSIAMISNLDSPEFIFIILVFSDLFHFVSYCGFGEERELILMLFVRLFDLCLFGFVGFLFLLGRAAVCDCGTPWTFLLPFLSQYPKSPLNSFFSLATPAIASSANRMYTFILPTVLTLPPWPCLQCWHYLLVLLRHQILSFRGRGWRMMVTEEFPSSVQLWSWTTFPRWTGLHYLLYCTVTE